MKKTHRIALLVAVIVVVWLYPGQAVSAAEPVWFHGQVQNASGQKVVGSVVRFVTTSRVYQSPYYGKNLSQYWGCYAIGPGRLSANAQDHEVIGFYAGGNFAEGIMVNGVRVLEIDPAAYAEVNIVVNKLGEQPTIPALTAPQPITTPAAGTWRFYGEMPTGTSVTLSRESQIKGTSGNPKWGIFVTSVPSRYGLRISPPAGRQAESVILQGWLELQPDANGQYWFWIGNIRGQDIGPFVITLK